MDHSIFVETCHLVNANFNSADSTTVPPSPFFLLWNGKGIGIYLRRRFGIRQDWYSNISLEKISENGDYFRRPWPCFHELQSYDPDPDYNVDTDTPDHMQFLREVMTEDAAEHDRVDQLSYRLSWEFCMCPRKGLPEGESLLFLTSWPLT